MGLVYAAIANPEGQVESYKFQLGKKRGRDVIRYLTACYCLDKLRRQLK